MTIDEVIAVLEKAEGPDRESDAAIAYVVGCHNNLLGSYGDAEIVHVFYRVRYDDAEVLVRTKECDKGGLIYLEKLPLYTASLDAALTLVPKGWNWRIYSTDWAIVDKDEFPTFAAKAATSAMALCIAALKARQHV